VPRATPARPTDRPPAAPAAPGAAALDRAFATARAEHRAALLGYLPVGYPDRATSLHALSALAEHADILELGLPYSDPILDGPSIQRANTRALQAGFRIPDLYAAARELSGQVPVLAMTYWNPVARHGPERFAENLADSGAAGVILPDLPVEEADHWLDAAAQHGLRTVFVVAPTAPDARLKRICTASGGFVYLPAAPGITGHAGGPARQLPTTIERLRGITDLPIGVGIGVSTPAQAADAGRHADAVIVGSALVDRLADSPSLAAGPAAVAELAAELAAGLHAGNPRAADGSDGP
jgi:tryptophan synthase alpha chain